MDEIQAHRSMRRDFVTGLIIALGILIALIGVAIDYLLPSTSPGLNLPQLLIIAAGLAISFGAWRFRQPDARRMLLRKVRKSLKSAVIVVFLTLLVLEIALGVWGMPTYFPIEIPEFEGEPATWWTCDEIGCHYQYEAAVAACNRGDISGRHCVVNPQGFADDEPFIAAEDLQSQTRILAMGDSFTHGYTADIGKSYIEFIEASIPDLVVWNTGITGSGTNQAISSFKAFAPTLQPQLSILGFYMNDFADNLIPVDSRAVFTDSNNPQNFVRVYKVDMWGNAFERDPKQALAYHFADLNMPDNDLQRVIGTTRLGTILLSLLDRLGSVFDGLSDSRLQDITRVYLSELHELALAQESALLVLLIPHRNDVSTPGKQYQWAISLMEDLNIPYLNPIDLIDPVADYTPLPDKHWTNSGHQKVGALLSECIEVFIVSGDLADCEDVIMP